MATKKTLTMEDILKQMEGNCGSCRYFKHVEDDFANCVRYPPTVVSEPSEDGAENELFSTFSVVSFDQWCGEFTPKG